MMQLDYPIAVAPEPGRAVPILPGIHWLRMPLPFALDHINLWLIEEEGGWSLIDTGISDVTTRESWELVFIGLMGGRPLKRLIVTHFHPDHVGLAEWLCQRFGLKVEMTLAEWLFGRMLALDSSEQYGQAARRFYRAAGCPEAMVERASRNGYAERVWQVPMGTKRIREGDVLTLGGERWTVMIGEGHAPEQACLWTEERGLLIAGDQVLPSISPNISIWPSEPDADHLKEFLASLERFRALPEDTLVLPSHGLPFRGLRPRIDALIAHHRQRLDKVLAACDKPLTAYEVIKILFNRTLDRQQMFFAIGESLAHLHYLEGEGKLVREADNEGVIRFRKN